MVTMLRPCQCKPALAPVAHSLSAECPRPPPKPAHCRALPQEVLESHSSPASRSRPDFLPANHANGHDFEAGILATKRPKKFRGTNSKPPCAYKRDGDTAAAPEIFEPFCGQGSGLNYSRLFASFAGAVLTQKKSRGGGLLPHPGVVCYFTLMRPASQPDATAAVERDGSTPGSDALPPAPNCAAGARIVRPVFPHRAGNRPRAGKGLPLNPSSRTPNPGKSPDS